MEEMVEALKPIANILVASKSAAVCVGALTMPISLLARQIASKWKAAKKFLKGWKMLVTVAVASFGTTAVWSQMPGVDMVWDWSAVLIATAAAVLTNEFLKATGIIKKTAKK